MYDRDPLLPIQHRTMFAELIQKCLDAAFDADFPENGSFFERVRNGRRYWYYNGYDPGPEADRPKKRQIYAGPADDPEVSRRVAEFRRIKDHYSERLTLVRSLRAAGLPVADRLTGDAVEALWKAGVFRMRCVLVGTTAFQAYAGLLGTRLANAVTATEDIDIAQFHGLSLAVDDRTAPLLDALTRIDPSFRPLPHQSDPRASTRIVNKGGFAVEFLTPNASSDDYAGKPAAMPALGGMSAEPLRFLDYLIKDAVWSALLHKGGVPVRVPLPERYAIHKLIVASRRRTDGRSLAKASKDVAQAETLLLALDRDRQSEEIGQTWIEAWERGPHWREALTKGAGKLAEKAREALHRGIDTAAAALKRDPAGFRP